MKKLILALILTLVFSLGVVAGEALGPDGWGWQKIGPIRRLDYLTGFDDGLVIGTEMHNRGLQELCDTEAATRKLEAARGKPLSSGSSRCILLSLWGETLAGADLNKTLDIMARFYSSPQNLPVHWSHAVIISQAMVSGVPISEKDLEVIRKEDATPPKPMSEKELQDLLGDRPKK